MSISENDLQIMNQAGLTIMQAKVYLSLLKNNFSSVTQISKKGQLDRGNCYRTIASLLKLGIVTKIIGRPTRYMAISFKDCVALLLEEKQKNYEKIKEATEKLAQNYEYEIKNEKGKKRDNFILIPRKTTFINKTIEIIKNTQKSIKCISSFIRYSQALNYSLQAHEDALVRGVSIQTIIDKPKNEQKIPKSLQLLMKYPNFEIRYLESLPEALGSSVDNKQVGILTQPYMDVRESELFSSIHPSLIAIFNKYFDCLWENAINLKKINNYKNNFAAKRSKEVIKIVEN